MLLSCILLVAATPASLQEEKESKLMSDAQWRVNLQKEFGSSLKLSRRLLCKTQILARRYVSLLLCFQLFPHPLQQSPADF